MLDPTFSRFTSEQKKIVQLWAEAQSNQGQQYLWGIQIIMVNVFHSFKHVVVWISVFPLKFL